MTDVINPEVYRLSDGTYGINVPDLDVYRERMHMQPEGFTKRLIQSMTKAFPDKFKGPEEAYCVCDVFKSIISTGLKNGETVHIEGLGILGKTKNSETVVFTPE